MSRSGNHDRLDTMTRTDGMSAENRMTMRRLEVDRPWLADQGVHLSQWGPDPETGKVKVYLAKFTDAARDLLIQRYGDSIVVGTQSRRWVPT